MGRVLGLNQMDSGMGQHDRFGVSYELHYLLVSSRAAFLSEFSVWWYQEQWMPADPQAEFHWYW